jgi:hypothetical protein
MSSKNQKKKKTQKNQGLEVNLEATRILRTVRDDEAFYFYEAFGKPTGEKAKSLFDFLEKISSVKLESLLFHLQRKDFENWIEKTLGDSKLAKEIGKITPSRKENLRKEIHSTIEKHINKLRDASLTLLVNPDLAVVSSSSTP